MSDESTLNTGGGEALPAAEVSKVQAPKNDAEAALLETKPVVTDAEAAKKAEDAEGERKKNRTKDYIARINRENAELRARVNTQPAPVDRTAASGNADAEPSLEDHNWDIAAFNKAHATWAIKSAEKEQETASKQAESSRRQSEIEATYNQKLADFAGDHDDFVEVVGSIAYPLSRETEAAIMAHDKGPEIAYHLGNNDDDAFQLASIQPHLAAAAVERLAKRLTAAQDTPEPVQGKPVAPAPVAAKPISRAPAPAATVSGRSPTETPSEKLTDDEWYRREAEKRRKR